jgi:hypothetical protein
MGANPNIFTSKENRRVVPPEEENFFVSAEEFKAIDTAFASKADQTDLNSLDARVDAEIRENNAVLFNKDYITGCQGTPRTGNITFDFTGAKLGSVTVLCHNDSIDPTIPSNNILLSGEYFEDVDNYYVFMIVKITSTQQVLCTICQEI